MRPFGEVSRRPGEDLFNDWWRNAAIRPAGFLQKPLAVQSTLDKTSTTLPRSRTLVGSTRAQVNGNHNRVHASLKSSRGPRGMSVAGSP